MSAGKETGRNIMAGKRVDIGLQVSPRIRRGGTFDSRPYFELARRSEAIGLHSVWSSDILSRPIPRFDSLTFLAALAAMTQKVRIGTQVLATPFRHPILLARIIATIDIISDGRFILGAGIASRCGGVECKAFGIKTSDRSGRTVEILEVIKRLWTMGSVTHSGKYFQFEDVVLEPKPVQKPHPPIWIGGDSEPAFRRVISIGNGWLAGSHIDPDGFRVIRHQIISLARETGRDPDSLHWACEINVNVNPDARRSAEESRSWYESHQGFITGGRSFDEVFLPAGAYGPPEICIEKMSRFIEYGAETIIIKLRTENVITQMDRLEKSVLPHFL